MVSTESQNSRNRLPEDQVGSRFILSGQQRILVRALEAKNEELGRIYYGGLHILSDTKNPEALSLAAHAIREMMEKIPEFLDVPVKALRESTKAKIREVEDSWKNATANSKCHHSGRWDGEIDGSARKLLTKLDKFFEWFRNYHPRRRDEIDRTLHRMDDSDRRIPPRLQNLNVTTWIELRDFFISVAHHRQNSSRDAFLQWLDALERFLLDRLVPRTFEDFEEIDNIVREGESDA